MPSIMMARHPDGEIEGFRRKIGRSIAIQENDFVEGNLRKTSPTSSYQAQLQMWSRLIGVMTGKMTLDSREVGLGSDSIIPDEEVISKVKEV